MQPDETPRKLTRSTTDKYVSGVSGGLGRYFGVDPTLFRETGVLWMAREQDPLTTSTLATLERVGVPCAPVNDVAELAATAQLQAMELVQTLPGSGVKVVGLPISFDGERPRPRSGSPRLGEHNEAVRPSSGRPTR